MPIIAKDRRAKLVVRAKPYFYWRNKICGSIVKTYRVQTEAGFASYCIYDLNSLKSLLN